MLCYVCTRAITRAAHRVRRSPHHHHPRLHAHARAVAIRGYVGLKSAPSVRPSVMSTGRSGVSLKQKDDAIRAEGVVIRHSVCGCDGRIPRPVV